VAGHLVAKFAFYQAAAQQRDELACEQRFDPGGLFSVTGAASWTDFSWWWRFSRLTYKR
jgi:hypothetical protein